jgi:hypothetical protein
LISHVNHVAILFLHYQTPECLLVFHRYKLLKEKHARVSSWEVYNKRQKMDESVCGCPATVHRQNILYVKQGKIFLLSYGYSFNYLNNKIKYH